MISSFEETMNDRMPGSRLGSEHRIQNKNLLLMYRGIDIPREKYKLQMKDKMSNLFRKKCELKISRKSISIAGIVRLYTYVLVCFQDRLKTRNGTIFDWDGHRPEIRTLRSDAQVDEVLAYLEDWELTLPEIREESEQVQSKEPEAKVELSDLMTEDHGLILTVHCSYSWACVLTSDLKRYDNILFLDKSPWSFHLRLYLDDIEGKNLVFDLTERDVTERDYQALTYMLGSCLSIVVLVSKMPPVNMTAVVDNSFCILDEGTQSLRKLTPCEVMSIFCEENQYQ